MSAAEELGDNGFVCVFDLETQLEYCWLMDHAKVLQGGDVVLADRNWEVAFEGGDE